MVARTCCAHLVNIYSNTELQLRLGFLLQHCLRDFPPLNLASCGLWDLRDDPDLLCSNLVSSTVLYLGLSGDYLLRDLELSQS